MQWLFTVYTSMFESQRHYTNYTRRPHTSHMYVTHGTCKWTARRRSLTNWLLRVVAVRSKTMIRSFWRLARRLWADKYVYATLYTSCWLRCSRPMIMGGTAIKSSSPSLPHFVFCRPLEEIRAHDHSCRPVVTSLHINYFIIPRECIGSINFPNQILGSWPESRAEQDHQPLELWSFNKLGTFLHREDTRVALNILPASIAIIILIIIIFIIMYIEWIYV